MGVRWDGGHRSKAERVTRSRQEMLADLESTPEQDAAEMREWAESEHGDLSEIDMSRAAYYKWRYGR